MARFRKKPVEVEAIQYEGGLSSGSQVWTWANSLDCARDIQVHDEHLKIKTLEGTMRASPGDWIIRGTSGEVYPCKPDVFDDVYEPADTAP